jgi:hypothetical protein
LIVPAYLDGLKPKEGRAILYLLFALVTPRCSGSIPRRQFACPGSRLGRGRRRGKLGFVFLPADSGNHVKWIISLGNLVRLKSKESRAIFYLLFKPLPASPSSSVSRWQVALIDIGRRWRKLRKLWNGLGLVGCPCWFRAVRTKRGIKCLTVHYHVRLWQLLWG